MPTTRHRRVIALLAALGSVLAAASGSSSTVFAGPIGTIDGASEVRDAATALIPAQRLSVTAQPVGGTSPTATPAKPIFPKQVEPVCQVLYNFGDGRSGGRVHQGVDIMGALGQEVYAVVNGTLGYQVIDGAADSSLSGNTWRLTAAGSKTWYVYMHLAGFAPGLSNGSVVTQGQVIGYVGDTGNPGPGNYHLHFEVHPDGGAAIDPVKVIPIPAACG